MPRFLRPWVWVTCVATLINAFLMFREATSLEKAGVRFLRFSSSFAMVCSIIALVLVEYFARRRPK